MKSRSLSAALLIVLAAFTPVVAAEQPAIYRLIVHPRNPASSVKRVTLRDAFLKKIKHWPHGTVIHPADLVADSRVRHEFSEQVLGRSVAAVKAYWQQKIFSGRDIPPPEFDRDEKVVAYVLTHEGGVGYVSGTAKLRGSKGLTVVP